MNFLSCVNRRVPRIVSWVVDETTGIITPLSDEDVACCARAGRSAAGVFETVPLVVAERPQTAREPGICRFFFENGRCLKGDACPYSHSLAALVKSGGISRTRPAVAPPAPEHSGSGDEDDCEYYNSDGVWLDSGCQGAPVSWVAPPFLPPPYFVPNPAFLPARGPGHDELCCPPLVMPTAPFMYAQLPPLVGARPDPMLVRVSVFSPAMPPQMPPPEFLSTFEDYYREEEQKKKQQAKAEKKEARKQQQHQQQAQQKEEQEEGSVVCIHKAEHVKVSSPQRKERQQTPRKEKQRRSRGRRDQKHQQHKQETPQQKHEQERKQGKRFSVTGAILESASRKFLDPYVSDKETAFFPRRRSTRPPCEHHTKAFLESGLFRSKPCLFFFETGFCLKGDRCNFSHDPHVLMQKMQKEP